MEEIRYKDFTLKELRYMLRFLDNERKKLPLSSPKLFEWIDRHIQETKETIRDFERAISEKLV